MTFKLWYVSLLTLFDQRYLFVLILLLNVVILFLIMFNVFIFDLKVMVVLFNQQFVLLLSTPLLFLPYSLPIGLWCLIIIFMLGLRLKLWLIIDVLILELSWFLMKLLRWLNFFLNHQFLLLLICLENLCVNWKMNLFHIRKLSPDGLLEFSNFVWRNERNMIPNVHRSFFNIIVYHFLNVRHPICRNNSNCLLGPYLWTNNHDIVW